MVAKPNIDIYFIFKIVEMETPLPQNCAVDYQLSRSMWMALPSVLQVYLNSLLQNFDVKVQSHNNIIPKRLLSKLKDMYLLATIDKVKLSNHYTPNTNTGSPDLSPSDVNYMHHMVKTNWLFKPCLQSNMLFKPCKWERVITSALLNPLRFVWCTKSSYIIIEFSHDSVIS